VQKFGKAREFNIENITGKAALFSAAFLYVQLTQNDITDIINKVVY